MKTRDKQILLLTLTAITVLGGYAFLRYAYGVTDSTPFTQEIVLIILGTVATVLITSLLLTQQTSVEIEKEQSIKFIELKTRTYEELISRIEEMTLSENITSQNIIRLQFTTHRLAIFSSPGVLKEFQHFLNVLKCSADDGNIHNDSEDIAQALARLTTKIRADLIGEIDAQHDYSQEQIQGFIMNNSNASMEINNPQRNA